MRNLTKLLLLIALIFVGNQFLNSQNLDKQEHYIYAKSVTIVDSAFMDLVVQTLSSDSIEKLLKNTFSTDTRYRQFLKSGFLNIEIQERTELNSDSLYRGFMNDDIKKIIDNNNNLKQVVISFNDLCSPLSKYVTKYKGHRFFFNSVEQIAGNNLFKTNSRVFKYPWDLMNFDRIWQTKYILFILYDNKLYIDPDYWQWFALTE